MFSILIGSLLIALPFVDIPEKCKSVSEKNQDLERIEQFNYVFMLIGGALIIFAILKFYNIVKYTKLHNIILFLILVATLSMYSYAYSKCGREWVLITLIVLLLLSILLVTIAFYDKKYIIKLKSKSNTSIAPSVNRSKPSPEFAEYLRTKYPDRRKNFGRY